MEDKVSIRRAVVAAQIQEAMSKNGMSRKQLADKMGKRPSEVTRWLSGTHNFTIDLLSEISESLGVQISGVVVDGYGRLQDSVTHTGSYRGLDCTVGPFDLPESCINNLERKAAARGENLLSYIKSVLIKEGVGHSPKAADFCGIWSDTDFGMTVNEQIQDIRSHRSVHRNIEEL